MSIFNIVRSHQLRKSNNDSIIQDLKSKSTLQYIKGYFAKNDLNYVYDEITKEKLIHNKVMNDLESRKIKLETIVYGNLGGV